MSALKCTKNVICVTKFLINVIVIFIDKMYIGKNNPSTVTYVQIFKNYYLLQERDREKRKPYFRYRFQPTTTVKHGVKPCKD